MTTSELNSKRLFLTDDARANSTNYFKRNIG